MIRRTLAIAAATAGLLAALSGAAGFSPPSSRDTHEDIARLARAVTAEEDHVTALELARWIRDRRKGLRILDLRSAAEFAEYRLPRAERVPMETLVATRFADEETLVLISDGGAHAAQAWVFLRALGHRNVYFLRGGVGEWIDEVMNPSQPSDLTRYFGGMPRVEGGIDHGSPATALRRRGC